MALFNLTELRALLARDQRLIGLDPGAKTIGVALSDVRLMLASPYASLRRGKLRDNAAELLAVARKEGAGGLVVGLPLSMDGTAGPAAQAARDWTLALSAATGLPAALWDERLSTAAVNRFLIGEADLSRKKRGGPGRRRLDAASGARCEPGGPAGPMIRLSKHTADEMDRRGIALAYIAAVIAAPKGLWSIRRMWR
jgi:putative Holliday junction resolvase